MNRPSAAEPPRADRAAALGAADAIVVALVFCFGVWLGTGGVDAFRAGGGRPFFYQSEFGPAVMLACGRGLQNPDLRDAPILADFLSQRADAFACGDLPATVRTGPLDPFQRACRLLEATVAMTWKATGVSWSRLAVLSGVLFGSVAALTYGVFRLALSRPLALAGLVPTFMSTPNVMLMPHLRDYAKGPFLLAVILIMGVLVVRPLSERRVMALSALAGLIVSAGLGFRTDLVVAMLPFLLTVTLLVPATVRARARAAAAVAFLVPIAVVTVPLLRGAPAGTNTGHVILLGLGVPFDRPLGIEPSIYEFGSQYNDSLAFSTINSYAIRRGGAPEGVDLATAEYDRAALAYLADLGSVFPADLVTRAVAAVRAVPSYFLSTSLFPPPWAGESVRTLYRLKAAVSSRLVWLAVPATLAATVVVSAVNPRAAWLIVVVLAGFAASSAVQFHERHFFYLQFIPWLAFGLIAQAVLAGRGFLSRLTAAHVARVAVFLTLVAAASGAAIGLSRVYQQRAAQRLFRQYETAPRTAVPMVSQPAGPGRALLTSAPWLDGALPQEPRILTRFLAVQFRDDQCTPSELPLTLRYEAAAPELDFSETKTVPLHPDAGTPTMLFFAAFDRPDGSSRFRGLELPSGQSSCVGAVFEIARPDQTPLLLTTRLAAGWQDDALYQRLR